MSRDVSGGGLEPAVAWCHEQATCATGQVKVGEGLPVATRSHGLTRGDVPKWEQAFDLGAVASSPVRTESHAGLDDPASIHVTVRVQRPHVSGRRRTNTNSALYPFRGGKTQLRIAREASRQLEETADACFGCALEPQLVVGSSESSSPRSSCDSRNAA